ncbi:hypothetical protein [Legionella jordanis]|uniref:Uncharacterized protein n=1 Tax=Legionella jordanis TaxID=456 RepID=A0A0W0VBS3_9GAMM|nr:hypothetical protein [Legionella jordanis]KTD17081.1 hypothetical protein Ljor_1387 [Legionella jordanis]RMX03213.1 hypothetical protein EAW55_07230 [Legionella jordanis]RMX18647.1 hypothetical protein EAS68_07465 [Legionella jordanis]VEH12722.1 Uncharacterised protein [Legionella jordanis]HAT8713129.1 hypothetical protein [Legionella jordanis]
MIKYQVRNNQALDFFSSEEFTDCKDIILLSPLHNAKAKEIYYNEADFNQIPASAVELIDELDFFIVPFAAMAIFKIGGGAFHYFLIQKECVANENFYRILQAHDQEYSLQDWLHTGRQWTTPAKEQFGKGQWLMQEQIKEFIQNLKSICSGDAKAYYNNFGAQATINGNVFMTVNQFLKKPNCQQSISVTIQLANSALVENSIFTKNNLDERSNHTTELNNKFL